jgi:hypothetical protein
MPIAMPGQSPVPASCRKLYRRTTIAFLLAIGIYGLLRREGSRPDQDVALFVSLPTTEAPLLFNHLIDRQPKPGRHRDACLPSTKTTSTPFLIDFANRSTSQFVILTQPCDSDLLTREGSAVP